MQSYWFATRYLKMIIVLAVALNVLSCKDAGVQTLQEAAAKGNEAYKQYQTADYATAKAALLDYVRYLEGRLADQSDPNHEVYKSDIVTSYGRLAKLEEKNNGPEKETYMQQATNWCQQLKIKWNCSAPELRKRIDGSDAAAK